MPLLFTADNAQMRVGGIVNILTSISSLPNTFMVPKLSINMISIGKLCELGFDVYYLLMVVMRRIHGRGKLLG